MASSAANPQEALTKVDTLALASRTMGIDEIIGFNANEGVTGWTVPSMIHQAIEALRKAAAAQGVTGDAFQAFLNDLLKMAPAFVRNLATLSQKRAIDMRHHFLEWNAKAPSATDHGVNAEKAANILITACASATTTRVTRKVKGTSDKIVDHGSKAIAVLFVYFAYKWAYGDPERIAAICKMATSTAANLGVPRHMSTPLLFGYLKIQPSDKDNLNYFGLSSEEATYALLLSARQIASSQNLPTPANGEQLANDTAAAAAYVADIATRSRRAGKSIGGGSGDKPPLVF